ncbi:MAG: ABC transporter substrate-binding protein [Rhodoglobus sp.]
MFTAHNAVRRVLGTVALGVAAILAGCASVDPLDSGAGRDGDGATITVGSQAYYSNEIISEIYAQALEDAGFTVDRKVAVGQRESYLPALEKGEIDVFPEYTGNLLQFYSPETAATSSDDVYAELDAALPKGLTVLDQAEAADQDSYNVTAEFAKTNKVASLTDLKNVATPLTLGGAAELEERPYGPDGLLSRYGVTVGFSATGVTTVEDLLAGTVNVANVYTADPRIQTENLVTLSDPEGLFLASNVVPLVNADIAELIAPVINAVQKKLTTKALVAMNVASTVDQKSSADIAQKWLNDNELLK